MGSKAPQWKQQSLTPESPYEEDVKEIETCGQSAIQTFPAPSITILEPRNTSVQMESLPTRDSRFQDKRTKDAVTTSHTSHTGAYRPNMLS